LQDSSSNEIDDESSGNKPLDDVEMYFYRAIDTSFLTSSRSSNHEMSSLSATGYHLQTTGKAAETAAAHTSDAIPKPSIEFMGACFCPFVQRPWICLELINQALPDEAARKSAKVDYTYVEIDPYKKPKELVEISPKGLVPVSRKGDGITKATRTDYPTFLGSSAGPGQIFA
jgi:hypothetical protein